MVIREYIENLRRDYLGEELEEATVNRDPIKQFEKWLEAAIKAELPDPHAMAVATAASSGRPSARVVLLRGFDHTGFSFYTNYQSRKGTDIFENPYAAAVFFWHELDRQVRIEGTIKKSSDTDSDKYFQSRPRENQIAAWASNQSEVIANRAELEKRFSGFERKFKNQTVPRPDNWGGFKIEPERFEFWQGRPGRLHDRIQYTLNERGIWEICRLAP